MIVANFYPVSMSSIDEERNGHYYVVNFSATADFLNYYSGKEYRIECEVRSGINPEKLGEHKGGQGKIVADQI